MSSEHLDPEALLAMRPTAELTRWRNLSLGIGVVGVGLTAVGAATNHAIFAEAYLTTFIFWWGIMLGSLALLMLQHLSGGAWGLLARRVFEASARTLPFIILLFLPIAFHLSAVFPWARPGADVDPQTHARYLNPTFFYIRAALYFAIWGTLIYLLTTWSSEQDSEPTRLPGPKDGRLRMLSGPGLVIYMLTLTFSSVDWVMSVDPSFSSTIFGILNLGQQGLSSIAFTVVILAMLSKTKPVSELAQPRIFNDLGNLILCFTMLWAYFNVSQLIIIYQGNLPEEITWYLNRMYGPWTWVAIVVLLGVFVIPFCSLLSRELKRRPRSVAKLAIFILVMRVIDEIWTIAPMFRQGPTLHWIDFTAVIGIGGFWLAFFFYNLGARAIVPAHDPYFKKAMAHGGH